MAAVEYHGAVSKITVHTDSNTVVVRTPNGQYTTTLQEAKKSGKISYENGTYFFSNHQKRWLKNFS